MNYEVFAKPPRSGGELDSRRQYRSVSCLSDLPGPHGPIRSEHLVVDISKPAHGAGAVAHFGRARNVETRPGSRSIGRTYLAPGYYDVTGCRVRKRLLP